MTTISQKMSLHYSTLFFQEDITVKTTPDFLKEVYFVRRYYQILKILKKQFRHGSCVGCARGAVRRVAKASGGSV